MAQSTQKQLRSNEDVFTSFTIDAGAQAECIQLAAQLQSTPLQSILDQLLRCHVPSNAEAQVLEHVLTSPATTLVELRPHVAALVDQHASAVVGGLRPLCVAFLRDLCASLLPHDVAKGVRLLAKLPPPSTSAEASAVLDVLAAEIDGNGNIYVRMTLALALGLLADWAEDRLERCWTLLQVLLQDASATVAAAAFQSLQRLLRRHPAVGRIRLDDEAALLDCVAAAPRLLQPQPLEPLPLQPVPLPDEALALAQRLAPCLGGACASEFVAALPTVLAALKEAVPEGHPARAELLGELSRCVLQQAAARGPQQAPLLRCLVLVLQGYPDMIVARDVRPLYPTASDDATLKSLKLALMATLLAPRRLMTDVLALDTLLVTLCHDADAGVRHSAAEALAISAGRANASGALIHVRSLLRVLQSERVHGDVLPHCLDALECASRAHPETTFEIVRGVVAAKISLADPLLAASYLRIAAHASTTETLDAALEAIAALLHDAGRLDSDTLCAAMTACYKLSLSHDSARAHALLEQALEHALSSTTTSVDARERAAFYSRLLSLPRSTQCRVVLAAAPPANVRTPSAPPPPPPSKSVPPAAAALMWEAPRASRGGKGGGADGALAGPLLSQALLSKEGDAASDAETGDIPAWRGVTVLEAADDMRRSEQRPRQPLAAPATSKSEPGQVDGAPFRAPTEVAPRGAWGAGESAFGSAHHEHQEHVSQEPLLSQTAWSHEDGADPAWMAGAVGADGSLSFGPLPAGAIDAAAQAVAMSAPGAQLPRTGNPFADSPPPEEPPPGEGGGATLGHPHRGVDAPAAGNAPSGPFLQPLVGAPFVAPADLHGLGRADPSDSEFRGVPPPPHSLPANAAAAAPWAIADGAGRAAEAAQVAASSLPAVFTAAPTDARNGCETASLAESCQTAPAAAWREHAARSPSHGTSPAYSDYRSFGGHASEFSAPFDSVPSTPMHGDAAAWTFAGAPWQSFGSQHYRLAPTLTYPGPGQGSASGFDAQLSGAVSMLEGAQLHDWQSSQAWAPSAPVNGLQQQHTGGSPPRGLPAPPPNAAHRHLSKSSSAYVPMRAQLGAAPPRHVSERHTASEAYLTPGHSGGVGWPGAPSHAEARGGQTLRACDPAAAWAAAWSQGHSAPLLPGGARASATQVHGLLASLSDAHASYTHAPSFARADAAGGRVSVGNSPRATQGNNPFDDPSDEQEMSAALKQAVEALTQDDWHGMRLLKTVQVEGGNLSLIGRVKPLTPATADCMGMYLLELRNHTGASLSNFRVALRPNRAGVQALGTQTAPIEPGDQGRLVIPLVYHASAHDSSSTSAVLSACVTFDGTCANRVDTEDLLPLSIVAPV